MNQIDEKKNLTTETKTARADEKAPRARLTVEVPTEITAGQQKNCVSCFCSRTYCCN